MQRARFATGIVLLLPILAFPVGAFAQTPGVDAARPTPSSWGGSVALLLVVLVLLLAIGVGVKLYDSKRKREDEALSLQSHLSDALLLEPTLAGLPVTAVASGSLWRRAPLAIAITGTVPTPELREHVMRLIDQELARRHPGARAEDRLVVDPLIGTGRARTLSAGSR